MLQVGAHVLAPLLGHQQLGEADDRLKRVVQLVRDARNELARRGEPFGMNQLIAKLHIGRDVALDADEVGDAIIERQRHDRGGGDEFRVVVAPVDERASPHLPGADGGRHRPEVGGRFLRQELR